MLRRSFKFPQSCAAIALAATFGSAQGQDRFSILDQCAKDASHADQYECLVQRMKESLGSIAEAQGQLMTKLRSSDEDQTFKDAAIAAAQEDGQEFVAYVGKHCESFSMLAYGGNSQKDRRIACHVELSLVRARQIRRIAESLP